MAPTVMLVEDQPDDEALALYALKRASSGHAVLQARDGLEAVALALGPGAAPLDLVLLDLHLPRLDGKGVLRRLRADRRAETVPVVVVSSSNEPVDVSECYGLRANSYVRKPLELRALSDDLSLVLFYWLQLNVPPSGETTGRRERRHASTGVHAEEERARPWTALRTLVSAEAHRAAQETGRKATAIVIDRDNASRARTTRVLKEVAGSVAVVSLASAEEAERVLASARTDPGHSPWASARLVLLDLDHHTEDGPKMITMIRSVVDHRLPIVVFTREDDVGAIDACYAHGVNSVVRKADEADYDDTVRLIGHYWLRVNETLAPGARVLETSGAGGASPARGSR